MLLSHFIKTSIASLAPLYPEEEARSMVMYYCTEVFGFPVYQHITEPATEIPAELLDVALDDMGRLAASEPLQYVLGYTEFCGRRFAVDERALIPRAETEVLCVKAEEMVAASQAARPAGEATASDPVRGSAARPSGSLASNLSPQSAVQTAPEGAWPLCGRAASGRRIAPPSCRGAEAPLPAYTGLRVLDLCTGSGCIAWTLALDLPGAEVVATDLSQDALDLADSQFRTTSGRPSRLPKGALRPRFVKADLLDVEASVAAVTAGEVPQREDLSGSYDLLTANPPYVMVAEKAEMRQNVLAWEPHMAIFAPDRDPLAFHKAIALVALRVLVPGGCGIVEINSELPDETAAVFTAAGFSDVRIIPDYFDRPRFISFRRK